MTRFSALVLPSAVICFFVFLTPSNGHRYIVMGGAEGAQVNQVEFKNLKHRVSNLEELVKMDHHKLNETEQRLQIVENILNPGFLQVVYDMMAINKLVLSMKDLDSKPPRATLYEDADYQGKELEYNADGAENTPCMNLGDLAGKVSSIKTHDTCVRVYSDLNCEGENEFITPFTNSTHLGAGDNKYKSIIGCMPPASA